MFFLIRFLYVYLIYLVFIWFLLIIFYIYLSLNVYFICFLVLLQKKVKKKDFLIVYILFINYWIIILKLKAHFKV